METGYLIWLAVVLGVSLAISVVNFIANAGKHRLCRYCDELARSHEHDLDPAEVEMRPNGIPF